MEEKFLHSLESIPLETIVKDEYRVYQIYTLMDRAIPYLQDGLKPGQRRILFTLWKNQSKGLLKVSAATGLVLTLHPHGPQSIETAIVNLAQDYTFSNNYPLIDKKGYFGERMEPVAAASRYIECKIGKVAELLLFDDMNQVEMVPNYDEKVTEPLALLPKLPIMLLNGAEGIGTGFSSVIPSFHHKDIVESIIATIETGTPKKLKPYVHDFKNKIETDKMGRLLFSMKIEMIGEKYFITELPRGYDARKIYKHLGRFVESGYLKDFIDSSVFNEVKIELVFKKGQRPALEDVITKIATTTSLVPNYTLISERGVKIFSRPEEIISIFTAERLKVVKRRYELLCKDAETRIKQNDEVIRFIKEKHYAVATKSKNRKEFVEYLNGKKFIYTDYLADMAIYRMTKEEVERRKNLLSEDKKKVAEYSKIASSEKLVKKMLIKELEEVSASLTDWLRSKDLERARLMKESLDKKKSSKSRQA